MAKLDLLKGFPILRSKLDFGEFHPDLAGNYVDVWLNLSDDFEARVQEHQARWKEFEETQKQFLKEVKELEGEALDRTREDLGRLSEEMVQSTAELYATMWDCTPEEYRQLVVLDTALTNWLFKRTWEKVREYREGRAKVLSG
jgi:predicted phage gp36 major capsid-like protein